MKKRKKMHVIKKCDYTSMYVWVVYIGKLSNKRWQRRQEVEMGCITVRNKERDTMYM